MNKETRSILAVIWLIGGLLVYAVCLLFFIWYVVQVILTFFTMPD